MSTAQPTRQITLAFRPEAEAVIQDLSAVRCIDRFLWLGADEGGAVERLTLTGDRGDGHCTFNLGDLIELPNGPSEEVDIEGLAYHGHYLWVLGSHSIKRKKPAGDRSREDNLQRLAALEREQNRYLLARIPLVQGQLFRQCAHPDDPDRMLTAARLKLKKAGSHLTHVLRRDPHLGPFLAAGLPGKDNGFDAEGIAVAGDPAHPRILIGLRGPVLRGWAVLLEVGVKLTGSGQLKLTKDPDTGDRYRKHFLDLQGHGIRDLCFDGEDLLILAGPTLDMDGLCHVYRLPRALTELTGGFLQPHSALDISNQYDREKAEGMTLLPDEPNTLLVVYDAPEAERLQQAAAVLADVFRL